MPPGQESVTLVIDYASISFSQRTSPRMAMEVLHVLQNHYVERKLALESDEAVA